MKPSREWTGAASHWRFGTVAREAGRICACARGWGRAFQAFKGFGLEVLRGWDTKEHQAPAVPRPAGSGAIGALMPNPVACGFKFFRLACLLEPATIEI